MHLTNYAINKESDKFEGNEDEFKKTMSETLKIIEEEQGPNGPKIIEKLKEQMNDIIVKTCLIGWP